MARRPRPVRTRGSDSWWSTYDADRGSVAEVKGGDAARRAAIDAGVMHPIPLDEVPFTRPARRRFRHGGRS